MNRPLTLIALLIAMTACRPSGYNFTISSNNISCYMQ